MRGVNEQRILMVPVFYAASKQERPLFSFPFCAGTIRGRFLIEGEFY